MLINILYGPEPFLLDRYKKKYTSLVQNPALNLSTFYGIEENLYSILYTYPVLDAERTVILYLDDLKMLGEDRKLHSFLENPSSFINFIVICKKADERTSLYKRLKSKGYITSCQKIADEKRLGKILLNEIAQRGGKIKEDAYALFLEKENYLERDDITLLNLISDIDRLVSYSSVITVDSVNALISDNPSKKMFELAKMIQRADFKRLRQQADIFSGTEISALAALLREYRIAWKSKYFSVGAIGVRTPLFAKESEEHLLKAMRIVTSAIDAIKYGTIPKDSIMLYTFTQLMYL